MKQTAARISIYSADVSGVASAMFELGGMVVIHDPSGCNSTYNTHDETRWYDHDSLIFISALVERDAILGNDDKLINDTVQAADEFHPKFIMLCGTPVPHMTGTDFQAIARIIEKKTGIPTFGLHTNNMHAYFKGAGEAFGCIAKRLVDDVSKGHSADSAGKKVNILGVTPLDFADNGADISLREAVEALGYDILSCWAMGSSLDDLKQSGKADLNLVVSSSGLEPAKILNERFGTPYSVGLPEGGAWPDNEQKVCNGKQTGAKAGLHNAKNNVTRITLIGEAVANVSLARYLEKEALKTESCISTRVLTMHDTPTELIRKCDALAEDEDEIIPYLEDTDIVIADPLYRPICPESIRFIDMPHWAFSGRMYRSSMPDLVKRPLMNVIRVDNP